VDFLVIPLSGPWDVVVILVLAVPLRLPAIDRRFDARLGAVLADAACSVLDGGFDTAFLRWFFVFPHSTRGRRTSFGPTET